MSQQYEDCILFLLSKAQQRALAVFRSRLQQYGLTPVQNLVIMALSGAEGTSAGDLARRVKLDNATLSGILDRLEEAGWILKETAEEDERFLSLRLSEKAHNLLEELSLQVEAANEEILEDMRIEEQLLLRRLLRDLQK